MTRDFEPIAERQIHQDDFGEGEMVVQMLEFYKIYYCSSVKG